MMRRTILTVVALGLGVGAFGRLAPAQQPAASPITPEHIRQINAALKRDGITGGSVGYEGRTGRLELQGTFEDERQVDRAFSIAQSVVGVRWVSPVTPQQIKVKAWEECLARIFSGVPCGPAGGPAPSEARGEETPPGPVANKYAMVVGAGRFLNRIQPLRFANKDAYDVYTYLIDPSGGRFHRENVVLLRDESATRANSVRALEELRRRAVENDLVFLFFSSHGTPPDKYGGVHIVTFDSEVTPRERIWSTSLTDGILRDFVQTVRAKRLVVVMDACYSNGAYRGVAGFLPPGGKSLEASAEEGYGRSSRYMAQRLLGAKDLLVEPEPLASASQRPANGWGKVLISASDAGERSWESEQLGNSVFTRFFLDGLRRNGGFVKEAFEYSKPLVERQVKREKGSDIEQSPQLTPSRRQWDLSLAAAEG
jgi:hypothetical protein